MRMDRGLVLAWAVFVQVAVCLVLADVEFTLLHTNDVHARVEQTDKYSNGCHEADALAGKCFGGVARRYTLIEEVRRNVSNVLLLDAGDEFQGTLWFNYYQGQEAARYMNWMRYDAMTLGNHEFDEGIGDLVAFLQNVTFPVVSSNIVSAVEQEFVSLFNQSVVLRRWGTRIGVVGCTTADTAFLVDPDHVSTITFLNEIDSVRAEVAALKAEGVNIIIALTHQGLTRDRQMALQVEDIDVIVGGHTHAFLYTGTPPAGEKPEGEYPILIQRPSGSRVAVVTAYSYGKYLGLLNLKFDSNGALMNYSGNPILLDNSIIQDPVMLADVEAQAQPVRAQSEEEVGDTYVLLDAANCRTQECTAGNMVTEAIMTREIRRPLASGGWADASFIVWNGGGVRASIEQGAVTYGDVLTMLPFKNEIVHITLGGRHVYEMFENSVSRLEENAGRFLQVSGVRVTYDLTRPVSQRVRSLSVLCSSCSIPLYEEVLPGNNYSFFTNSYMSKGGDSYTMLLEDRLDIQYIGNLESETVTKYFQSRSPVLTIQDDRITMSGPPPPIVCKGNRWHSAGGAVYLFIALLVGTRWSPI